MRRQMPVFFLILLFLVFNAGIAAAIFSGKFVHGGAKPLTTYSGMGVAFVTSTVLIRQQQVKVFLASRPVLWFLFLFNAAVGAVLFFALAGPKGSRPPPSWAWSPSVPAPASCEAPRRNRPGMCTAVDVGG